MSPAKDKQMYPTDYIMKQAKEPGVFKKLKKEYGEAIDNLRDKVNNLGANKVKLLGGGTGNPDTDLYIATNEKRLRKQIEDRFNVFFESVQKQVKAAKKTNLYGGKEHNKEISVNLNSLEEEEAHFRNLFKMTLDVFYGAIRDLEQNNKGTNVNFQAAAVPTNAAAAEITVQTDNKEPTRAEINNENMMAAAAEIPQRQKSVHYQLAVAKMVTDTYRTSPSTDSSYELPGEAPLARLQ